MAEEETWGGEVVASRHKRRKARRLAAYQQSLKARAGARIEAEPEMCGVRQSWRVCGMPLSHGAVPGARHARRLPETG